MHCLAKGPHLALRCALNNLPCHLRWLLPLLWQLFGVLFWLWLIIGGLCWRHMRHTLHGAVRAHLKDQTSGSNLSCWSGSSALHAHSPTCSRMQDKDKVDKQKHPSAESSDLRLRLASHRLDSSGDCPSRRPC